MIRHALLRSLPLLLLAGCGAAGRATPQAAAPAALRGPAGAWALVTIDGAELPVVPNDRDRPAEAPAPPEILGGKLVVAAAGTFTSTMQYRFGPAGSQQVISRDMTGSWQPEGAGFVFTWQGAGGTPVTLAGDTLIMNNVGMLLAYLRAR